MNISEEKSKIRKTIKLLKQNYSYDEFLRKSKSIFTQVERSKEFLSAKIVLAYWSMKDEVCTHFFVEKWYKQKTILLPVVNGNELVLRQFFGKESMVVGSSFGILEPTGEDFINLEEIDVIIVPGMAFDKENNRLGRGKAFYDKLLRNTKATKMGVCFNFQLLDNVPVDSHDVKMDKLFYY